MAISVALVSSDLSKEKIPTIAPTTPLSPDYTPASLDYSLAPDIEFDPYKDPPSDHIPPLPAISPFLSSTDDTTDSDTPDTPPSPTLGTPFTEITSFTHISYVIPHRRVMILASEQPIPHGRPYRYHPNRPTHMMTVRKRVGPLHVQQLAVGYHVDHSSSDYFSLDDSTRDSSSDSSSEASSDFHSDASSDSSSRHSLSDHFSPDLPSTSAGESRKRRRSPMIYVPALSPVFGALSFVRTNLIPSPKRVRDSGYLADIEAEIDECIAYADALRDRGIDARVVVEAVDREESKTGTWVSVEVRVKRVTHHVMPEDTTEPALDERAVECTYETLGSLVQKFHDHTVAILVHCVQAVAALTERIVELEMDNRRLRGTASVKGQRVDRLQRGMSPEEMEAREAAMNLKPLNENEDEQECKNGGDGNGGNRGNGNRGNGGNGENGNGNGENGNRERNRNRNGNRNHGINYGGFMPVARECTFQDFLKCKPYNFSGTEGVVGLTR
nr:hypothetical protein [Tanacetum cinerariifolium]